MPKTRLGANGTEKQNSALKIKTRAQEPAVGLFHGIRRVATLDPRHRAGLPLLAAFKLLFSELLTSDTCCCCCRSALPPRSIGASKPVNSSRAVAMLMRVQLSSASPGGSTASTKVLLVSRAIIRLKRGVLT